MSVFPPSPALPEPVSQLQADFTLLDRGSGPRVEVSCQAASGSPPITYRLVERDEHIYMWQRPDDEQPANFSFPLTQLSHWFQCQAANNISFQCSAFTLVPPGQLPHGPIFLLAGVIFIAAMASWNLGWMMWIRSGKQVFALIVFSCIFGEGYSNTHESQQQYCVFNRNEDACRYGSAIGVLAFLASAFFFVVDVYFPQISNATDRKYLVIGDLLFSALWTFLWFVGFCFLTNQWAATKLEDVRVGADSARAAITFSFFSIFSWGVLASLAYQRYKAGVDDFIQNYVDPTPDPSSAYASYPGGPPDNYQQPPFTQNAETAEGYQPPPVY
ncbi:synaptogyrin 2-like protein [Camelus ferus]|nr:synaptogyrin 2-like protein [Camelus ferus]